MHDVLYENQPLLDSLHLVRFAQELGLDSTRFERELKEGIYRQHVRRDFLGGVRSGVNGTPAFFIGKLESNGTVMRAAKVIVGLESYETFKAALDEILQSH